MSGFLSGLLSGTQSSLQRRVDQTNQDRLQAAASRRFATQMAREDLRHAVADQQWQQSYDQRGQFHEDTLAQRQSEAEGVNTRAENALAQALKIAEMQEAGLTDRHTTTTNLQRLLEKGRNTRFVGQIDFEREIANLLEGGRNTRHGESLSLQDTLARLQEQGINTRHISTLMQRKDEADALNTYRNSALSQADRHFSGTLGMRQEELAQRVNEADAMNWYRENQANLGWAEHEARKLGGYYNRGGSGRPDGLSSQAYESIKNMADVFVKTQNDIGKRWWLVPDARQSPLQQARHFESMGAAIMNQLMTSTGGDPVEALKGLPVFWSHMLTSGEEGKYGAELQKDILHGVTPKNRYERYDAMYNAVMRGALRSIGQEIPQADSGITELQNDQPQSMTKAIQDWQLDRFAMTQPTSPISPLVGGMLLRDALKNTGLYKGFQNWGRSPENRIQ